MLTTAGPKALAHLGLPSKWSTSTSNVRCEVGVRQAPAGNKAASISWTVRSDAARTWERTASAAEGADRTDRRLRIRAVIRGGLVGQIDDAGDEFLVKRCTPRKSF